MMKSLSWLLVIAGVALAPEIATAQCCNNSGTVYYYTSPAPTATAANPAVSAPAMAQGNNSTYRSFSFDGNSNVAAPAAAQPMSRAPVYYYRTPQNSSQVYWGADRKITGRAYQH